MDYFWLPRNEMNRKKKIMIWRREIEKPIIFIEAVSNGFSRCRVARWLVANRKQVGDDATCWLLVSRNPEVGFHQVFFVSRFCPRFLLSSFAPVSVVMFSQILILKLILYSSNTELSITSMIPPQLHPLHPHHWAELLIGSWTTKHRTVNQILHSEQYVEYTENSQHWIHAPERSESVANLRSQSS